MPNVIFDNSLDRLVATLTRLAGREFIQAGTALRDASGRLSFIAGREPNDEDEREKLGQAIINELGAYARHDRPIAFRGDFGSERILCSQERLPVQVDGGFCYVLDRRIVGAGWLENPASEIADPPRIVFATLKGGVGRSTALAVAASDLAHRNKNVLVVDLDLEAPGLGHLLLDIDRTPEFGIIDYLVENGLQEIGVRDLRNFIGSSMLTDAGGGRVDVMPALGRCSLSKPENIVAKLSRAMIEDVSDDRSISVTEQISTMISRMTSNEQYDVVFIDSRAGLSELAASAVLGLGATVLLFGTAQKQTIEGYRALFAALQQLAQRDRGLGRDAEWRTMLKPVYAKASLDPDVEERFIDEIFDLFSEHIYDAESSDGENPDALRYARDDRSAPHWPSMIPFNSGFIDFDPSHTPGQLTKAFYEQTYRAFLSDLDTAMAGAGQSSGALNERA